ncbi:MULTISPECIES: BspA family leucine-rich repeat surface protein [Flavobacteriaceae]|uniref:BspA family leucine-rich repeat surface protein n=1 Tax=Flavobacteriaceae TaxID=49546 RepID=UPI00234ADD52|nr:BspA family leucine-rich repeat surface protein [Muricauda sp. SP22]MDC6362821.1 BspA family leucine-rich repeat surface protein [Muricauda sp. SP22]
MKLKNLFYVSLLALAVISCSKDDGPDISNNNTPVITDPKTFNVPENIDDMYVIGTIKATDADEEDTLEFSISANSDALFEITKAGALSLANGKSLDFATKSQHIISVSVSDGKDSAKANITINVTEFDENNGAPSFNEASYAYQVDENIGSGVVFGTLTADDPESDPLEFLITENDNELFAITPQGSLSVAEGKNLDFETSNQHIITVGVTDDNTTTTIQVTINVTDDGKLADDPDSFVMVWSVVNGGLDIEIGLNQAYNDYDFEIDWGDGHTEVVISNADLTHSYEAPGDYTVAIMGAFLAIKMSNSSTKHRLVGIEQWGTTVWQSMEKAFFDCISLKNYNATDIPNLSQVTIYDDAFAGATNFNGNLNNWDVSNATSMIGMFSDASAFNQDLNNWVVENVTNMSYMFSGATAFDGDISTWNVQQVTNMNNMFQNASSFNGAIGGWTTTQLNTMEGMFSNALAFNQDLDWDTSQVTNMSRVFHTAVAFNGNIGSWDTGQVTTMEAMFKTAVDFNQDISTWNTTNVLTMNSMFSEAVVFNQDLNTSADLSAWNVENVTDMERMFDGALAFNGNISNWNTGKVTTMRAMFQGGEGDNDSAFNGDITGWDTSAVTTMMSMFNDATSFNRDLGDWNIENVTSMAFMLSNSGLSTFAYDGTLIGWSAQNIQAPSLTATGLQYCDVPEVNAARQTLNDKGMNISGDNAVPCF